MQKHIRLRSWWWHTSRFRPELRGYVTAAMTSTDPNHTTATAAAYDRLDDDVSCKKTSQRSTHTNSSRWWLLGRVLLFSLTLSLVIYVVGVITIYSSKLISLQERVTELERNCVRNDHVLHDLIAQHVDKRLQEVSSMTTYK